MKSSVLLLDTQNEARRRRPELDGEVDFSPHFIYILSNDPALPRFRSGNNIGPRGIIALATHIEKLKNLQSLDLRFLKTT
jgi:hypothetical protein